MDLKAQIQIYKDHVIKGAKELLHSHHYGGIHDKNYFAIKERFYQSVERLIELEEELMRSEDL